MSSEKLMALMFADDQAHRGKMIKGSYSGAVISRSSLFIGTILAQRNGNVRLDHGKCTVIGLDGEEQRDIREFALCVHGFLARKSIDRLLLRMAPPKSQYGGRVTGAVIRTALQLIDDLRVDVIHTFTMSRWADREQPDVPDWIHTEKYRAAAQRRAIETAIYFSRYDRAEAA